MWPVETLPNDDTLEIRDSIHKLSTNEIGVIRIPGIYTDKEVSTIVENIDQQGVSWYPNFEQKQGRIGICATEYVSKDSGKEAYFALEAKASEVRDRIFPGQLDPVKKMMSVFSHGFDISLAKEPSLDNARYFTGLIRAMAQKSTTHFDFAPRQLPGWQVAEAEAQFAVITYLQMPETGGGLTVYNRQWVQADDEFDKDTAEKGPKGFENDFLDDDDSITVSPSTGEMVVINSRNFHRVEAIVSKLARYSINSFMSLSEDKLVLWN